MNRIVRALNTVALTLTAGIPAFALALGGIAKLNGPFLSANFIAKGLSFSLENGFRMSYAVAGVELVLAVLLCIYNGCFRLAPAAALCLMAFFIGLLVSVSTSQPDAATRGCFGTLMGDTLQRSLWSQVWIDVGLAAMLVGNLALFGPTRPRQQAPVQG